MATQHATFIALAKRLIPANGRDISIVGTTMTGESWDPVVSETVKQTVKAINVDFKLEDVGSSLVNQTDKLFIFDADAVIAKSDVLRDGTEDLEIVYIKPIKIGENLIITKVWTRK